MKLVYGIIIFVVTFFILLMNDENKKSKERDALPPDGFATDYLLMTHDLNNGVSKLEMKRREREGYYLKPCDKHRLIDNKMLGKPYYGPRPTNNTK